MPKVIFMILVMVGVFGHAHSVSEQVEHLNQAVKQAGQDKRNCPTCDAGREAGLAPAKSATQKCVESLCPRAEISISHILNVAGLKALGKNQVFDTELAPLIKKIATESARKSISDINELSDWLKTAPPLTDPDAIRLFNFLASLKHKKDLEFEERMGLIQVNEEDSRKKLPQLSDAEYQRVVQVGNAYMHSWYTSDLIDEYDPGLLRIMYPDGQLSEHIKEITSKLKINWQKIKDSKELHFLSLSFFNSWLDEDDLQLVVSSGEINSEAIDSLNAKVISVSVFERLVRDKHFKAEFKSGAIDIKSYVERNNFQKEMAAAKLRAEQFLKNGNSQLLAKCKVAFTLGQEVLPTAAEITKFKKRESHVKTKFKDSVGQLLSASSKAAIDSSIDDWIFSYPLTQDAHLKSLKQSLRRAADEAASWQKKSKEMRESPMKDQIYSFKVAAANGGNEAVLHADEICEALVPDIIPDAAYSPKGGLSVGPLVVQHPDLEGVVHHELGHLLYATLKTKNISSHTKNWFDQSRACLTKNHVGLAADDDRYQSEDWADLIGGHVMKGKSNFACVFRPTNFDQGVEISLKNSDDRDIHSSDFFRLLHLAFLNEGDLSPVCKSALEERKEKAQFANCAIQKVTSH